MYQRGNAISRAVGRLAVGVFLLSVAVSPPLSGNFNNWQQNSRGVGGNQLNDMPFFDLLAPQYLADETTAANAADAPVALYTIPTDWRVRR